MSHDHFISGEFVPTVLLYVLGALVAVMEPALAASLSCLRVSAGASTT
jgi:hypothetical protein